MTEQAEYEQKSFLDAWDRLARTKDGLTVYRHLQKIVEGIPEDVEGGALRENLGRRKLAAEIRAAMSEGIRASNTTADERPVVYTFAKPGSVTSRRPRGVGPRIGHGLTAPDAAGPAGT